MEVTVSNPRLANVCFMSLFQVTFVLFTALAIPLATSLMINFTDFSSESTLNLMRLEGDATIIDGFLDLTNGTGDLYAHKRKGRASLVKPIQLYDNQGNHTSFITHFSFIIDSAGQTRCADGLAFFLMPNGSSLNSTLGSEESAGCNLGLMSSQEQFSQRAGSFVAVEFDTFSNEWDPEYEHVGIDVNFLKSVHQVKWKNRILEGHKAEAWIRYDSSTNNLEVNFTNFGDKGAVEISTLNYAVNLSQTLTEWVIFGFSASTGGYTELHKILSWDFTTYLRHEVHSRKPDTHLRHEVPSRKPDTRLILFWSCIGATTLVASLLIVWLVLSRRKRVREEGDDHVIEVGISIDRDFEQRTGPRKFSYDELALAINNFDEKGKLGKGGFGGVYKGHLKESISDMAVKRVSKGSKQGIKEYVSEVKIISQLRHRNLVQLLGWCHEKGELLLVYEFTPNGSLDRHLFKGGDTLSWEKRYRIVQGLASALLYLHEFGDRCVLHRDIKSSNIMLDSEFNAKLGDFGLARLVDHTKGTHTTVLAGTRGYMAPECFISGKANKESDIYSFGVVALEIACGRRPDEQQEEENHKPMVEWVWDLYGLGKIYEAADPRLAEQYDKQQMECLIIIGLWCAHPDSTLRPSIRQVISVLNLEAAMPILPPKMPVLRFIAPLLDIPALMLVSPYTATDSNDSC